MKELWRKYEEISRNMKKYVEMWKKYEEIWRNYEGYTKKDIWRIMKGIWRNYEGYMKKYEGIMKGEIWRKYEEICGKYENKDSLYIWVVGLGKISRSSSFFGAGGWGGGSQFPGLEVPQRKDMKHVNIVCSTHNYVNLRLNIVLSR